MHEDDKIGRRQFVWLLLLFELGTALVLGVGTKAGQDAWIAVLFGTAGGCALYSVYVWLYRLYPGMTLVRCAQAVLGRRLGWAVGFAYMLFFLYCAARNMRDGGDLLITSLYESTPLAAVTGLMSAVLVYVLYKGIEVLARTGEFFGMTLVGLGVVGSVLIFCSGIVRFSNLLPVLENGIQPVLAAFPETLTFPFGETVSFLTVFPFVRESVRLWRRGVIVTAIAGLVIAYNVVLNISVLGVGIFKRSVFPLLATISMVNIAEFLQRLDAIVILSFIISDFFKIAVYMFASAQVAADLFGVRQARRLATAVGLVVWAASSWIADNLPEHLWIGTSVLPVTLFLPFQIGIPVLLLAVAVVRKRVVKSS